MLVVFSFSWLKIRKTRAIKIVTLWNNHSKNICLLLYFPTALEPSWKEVCLGEPEISAFNTLIKASAAFTGTDKVNIRQRRGIRNPLLHCDTVLAFCLSHLLSQCSDKGEQKSPTTAPSSHRRPAVSPTACHWRRVMALQLRPQQLCLCRPPSSLCPVLPAAGSPAQGQWSTHKMPHHFSYSEATFLTAGKAQPPSAPMLQRLQTGTESQRQSSAKLSSGWWRLLLQKVLSRALSPSTLVCLGSSGKQSDVLINISTYVGKKILAGCHHVPQKGSLRELAAFNRHPYQFINLGC